MLFLRYILYTLFIFSLLGNNNPKDRNIFRPPLNIPVLLSANFGELRIDHFHSGVDIKTQGTTGKDVVAASEGYIYRISVSPGGFGKALYIKHPSGYSTVYAHLDRFTPEIEEYVRAQQYEKQSFLVTLFPSKEKFPVKQGQLIAYSGNSGSSGGPHLHFEIRKTESEIPVNPLLFNIGITDNIPPVIEKLAVYPEGKDTYINNRKKSIRINLIGSNGKYSLPEGNEILINGKAAFGLKIHDMLDGSPNKCAGYSIEVKIDSTVIYRYVMDEFSFNESRYVNSHIDYETFMRDNMYIERAFVLPNDKLGSYKKLVNRGIYNFNDNKLHTVHVTVTDVNDNKSSLIFRVKSISEKPVDISAPSDDNNARIMPYNKANRFAADGITVNIPAGALYDTLNFTFKKSPRTPVMLSDIYSVHNKYVPVQKAYTLAIKPLLLPAAKESKMLIVQLGDNNSKKPVPGTWDDGYLKADVLAFGDYYIGIDTVQPSISPLGLKPGADLTGRKEFRIKITDDFSGIKSYEPTIDGKWALFEYDPKNEVIIYKFDSKYITKGKKHSLSLKVSDNVDNVSYYNCDFTW